MNWPSKGEWRWVALLLIFPLLAILAFAGLRRSKKPADPEQRSVSIRHAAPSTSEQAFDPKPETAAESRPPTGIRLTDVTAQTGITFVHDDGGCGEKYLVEPASAGLAIFDYDGDGLVDIYFLSGAPLPPAESPPRTNALYRNEGDFHFRDVTDEAGVGDTGFGLGVAVGDYDNNGWPDLYVNNFGPNVLYRNNGDGTFTEATKEGDVAAGDQMGAGASFVDIDADGDLDLYVANYLDRMFENHVKRTIDGFPCYPGPLDFDPTPDTLYRNNGNGTFTDISEEAGIGQVSGSGMTVVCADFDNNGATDIFVANDQRPNFLFENDGTGKFREVALLRGVAYNLAGKLNGNMGVACADYDNDGWIDLFSTTFNKEMPVLYRNRGNGFFDDVTLAKAAGISAMPHANWGTEFVDFDNDGHRDLFIANGSLDQNIHLWSIGTSFKLPDALLMNRGDGSFVDVSDRCGSGLKVVESSRGAAFDDLDNDGAVDAVILNSDAVPTILHNTTRGDAHWLQVCLRGRRANRDGIGAQVRVTAGGQTQLAEVHSGRGYQSHYGMRLHYGLGPVGQIDRVEVRWPGGDTEVIENVVADRLIFIAEGDVP